jgi:signal transduction histidine kinase
MSAPWATKRHAIIIVAMVWLLVCGGLAWATRSALMLESLEAAAVREKAEERAREEALSRVDNAVELVLSRERARPYSHFRPRFIIAKASDVSSGAELKHGAEVDSPLQKVLSPQVLLHFQVSETQGWSSPQIGKPDESAAPVYSIPAAHRTRETTPANWLAALAERYSLPQLLQEYEQAHEFQVRQAVPRGGDGARAGADQDATPAVRGLARVDGATEYARRAARLLELSRENPLLRCEPELVALENLESIVVPPGASEPRPDCVEVTPSAMMPVWLDLIPDDPAQLVLLRTVTVDFSRYCTIQGVVLDWNRLREFLESSIYDLFPNARIVPLRQSRTDDRRSVPTLLTSIPARLDPGPLAAALAPPTTGSLRTGLAVAWVATLLALTAISYGTLKYVGMAQRRMQFVAAVTHELRTPLTSFQLYSDLLTDMPHEDAQRRNEYALRLQIESKRLARLVENVLAYSRITESGPHVHARTLPVSELLAAATSATKATCEAAGKQLVLENRCAAVRSVETDPEFVIQILANLIENACKYSADAPNPSIWLSAAPAPDGGVVLEIEDAGAGVPARDRRTIFEPFRRSDAARAGGAGGVGLGLALSRHWAECLGGRLSLKHGSRNGPAYNCFSLALPPPGRLTLGSPEAKS